MTRYKYRIDNKSTQSVKQSVSIPVVQWCRAVGWKGSKWMFLGRPELWPNLRTWCNNRSAAKAVSNWWPAWNAPVPVGAILVSSSPFLTTTKNPEKHAFSHFLSTKTMEKHINWPCRSILVMCSIKRRNSVDCKDASPTFQGNKSNLNDYRFIIQSMGSVG